MLTGFIDSAGQPRITIRVFGTHPTAYTEADALIDAGFVGFLMLPVVQALPLGIQPYGTNVYTLADGSQTTVVALSPSVSPQAPEEAPAIDRFIDLGPHRSGGR